MSEPVLGTATLMRLTDMSELPFVISELERAGIPWNIDRPAGLAATIQMGHGGDPAKALAAQRICAAVNGDGDAFAERVAKSLSHPAVQRAIRTERQRQGSGFRA